MSFTRRVLFVLVVILAACSDREFLNPSPEPTGELSVAMVAWTPGAGDDCTVEVHNRFTAIGPDGKRYPTWHPPVDPSSGCSFGHEHGRDPRGSDLYARVGAIPFGYLLGRMNGVNLFRVGSGNIGATNLGRVVGRPWGVAPAS